MLANLGRLPKWNSVNWVNALKVGGSSYHRLHEAAKCRKEVYDSLTKFIILTYNTNRWLCEAAKNCSKLWHSSVPWIKYGNLFAPKVRNIPWRHMFPAAIFLWYHCTIKRTCQVTIPITQQKQQLKLSNPSISKEPKLKIGQPLQLLWPCQLGIRCCSQLRRNVDARCLHLPP